MSEQLVQHAAWKARRQRLMAPRRERELASAAMAATLPAHFTVPKIPEYRLIYYAAADVVFDEWSANVPTGKLIIRTIAGFYGLPHLDMLSDRRTELATRARQVASYLCRHMTKLSYARIGALLGGRDHSTVLHGYKRIKTRITADRELAEEIRAIQREVTNAMGRT
jgi:hypothetical protein